MYNGSPVRIIVRNSTQDKSSEYNQRTQKSIHEKVRRRVVPEH
jgi:hypothetical protein